MAFEAGFLAESSYALLAQRISLRSARVVVVGMGYVGAQVALAQVRAGFRVAGLDSDLKRLSEIRGSRDFDEPTADALTCSDDAHLLESADVVVICVGTPLNPNGEPDLTALASASRTVAGLLHPGELVIVESTVYPGATEGLVRDILDQSGLVCGEDYFLAYAPERVDPGNTWFGFRNTPKLVGGITPGARQLATLFYSLSVDEVHEVSAPRVAEMAKLYENTYRAVNISFVNEISLVCHEMDIDVWEMLEAAGTKPFGLQVFRPGPGIGGHCIPVDPFYLSWKAREYGVQVGFVDHVARVNWQIARHIADEIARLLGDRGKCLKGASVLVLGVAYKADVADIRESPALRILPRLLARGANIAYHDPHVPELALPDACLRSVPLAPDVLRSVDCALILADHADVDYESVVRHAPLVYDTRNVTRRFRPASNVVVL